jgi:hypothetical protein
MNKIKKITAGIVTLSLVVLGLVLYTGHVSKANVSSLQVYATSAGKENGTTTIAYLTPGAGTTTLAFNSVFADTVDLDIIQKASSTLSILKWRYEYSDNGIDWYGDNIENTTNATTTVVVRDFSEYSWTFASSTAGTSGATSASGDRALKHVRVPDFSARYFRVVFYVPPGSANAGVWAHAVVKSNNNQ